METKRKFREPVELNESTMEYRDHIIEELKARTGSSMVNLIAYRENQLIPPYTLTHDNIILECRVGNQISKIVITEAMNILQSESLYYGMREIVNRMIDALIKAGAQAL